MISIPWSTPTTYTSTCNTTDEPLLACPLYTCYIMIRTATALLALISVLGVPMVSSACMARCDSTPLRASVAVCHEKTHQHSGSYLHGMHHPASASRENGQDIQAASLPCHTVACSSMKPARMMRFQITSRDSSVVSSVAANGECNSLALNLATDSRSVFPASNIGSVFLPLPLRV